MKSGRGGARPNAGRPPRTGSATTKTISIRLTGDEYNRLQQKADTHSLTITEYIRSKIAE